MTNNQSPHPEGLLACPFCGGTDHIDIEFVRDGGRWEIQCIARECPNPLIQQDTREAAIVGWNTRATPVPSKSPGEVIDPVEHLKWIAAGNYREGTFDQDQARTILAALPAPTGKVEG